MNIIGRRNETDMLNHILDSRRPEFLVVYGRRRVGKTFLIREYFNQRFSFYATGTPDGSMSEQLEAFNDSLKRYGKKEKSKPETWIEAFSNLRDVLEKDDVIRDAKTGKRVVFLDELPWFDTPRSGFKNALDYFWNSWGSAQQDLLLVVCGSAASWIMTNIINNTGGLYNRITSRMYLRPFSLKECELLLKDNGIEYTRHQIVESYMVFGGIPYYLNCLDRRLSLAQNIDELFFKENGQLRYEYRRLFSSLFKNHEMHAKIAEVLFKRKSGLTRNEIIQLCKFKSGNSLTKTLTELEECGFIRSYHDFTKKNNGKIYQLIDSLTLFYLTFLDKKQVSSWNSFINSPAYFNWCSLSFERVCMLHSEQIKEILRIGGIETNEFAWRSEISDNGAQVDLLIDRKDNAINLCEMKYSSEEFAIDAAYEKTLIHKRETFRNETKTKKTLLITMITPYGLKRNEFRDVVVNEISEDELFI